MKLLVSFAVIGLMGAPQTAVKDVTLPPADARVKTTAVGLGVQVYACVPQPGVTPAKYAWTLQMPEATLFDPATHQPVGTHAAGPTWTWKDGSEIAGEVIQTQPAKDPASVPWLLLKTHSTGPEGVLSDVMFVRRSETQAGVPTTECDAVHQNNIARVPYQATYTFYTTGK
ncbi:MAG: DUF3455 domain-containing protein [Acidobacteria bacterium]|nr:DUF3455 domain-containing protein [Acidobacteriota bacterium]